MQTDNRPLLRDLDADWRNTHPDWSGEWYTIEQVEQDAMLLEARRDQREREGAEDDPRSAAELAADDFAAEVLDTQRSDRP